MPSERVSARRAAVTSGAANLLGKEFDGSSEISVGGDDRIGGHGSDSPGCVKAARDGLLPQPLGEGEVMQRSNERRLRTALPTTQCVSRRDNWRAACLMQ